MKQQCGKYEELIGDIGSFGKFQKRMCLMLILSSVPNGYFALSMVFIGRTPPTYRCFVSGQFNGSASESTTEATGLTTDVDTFSTSLAPTTVDWGAKECGMPDNSKANSSHVTGCPNGYVYGFEEGRTTIVTEWDLVCDRAGVLPLIMSIYMSGVLAGSVFAGSVADRFGRYPTFMIGTLMMYVFLGLCGLAPSVPAFAAFLWGAGLFGYVNYVAAFIMVAEITDTSKRVVVGTMAVGGFAAGYMLLPVFAYFIGNWRVLCAVLAALGVFYIPYIWLIEESPRWLYAKGRKEDFAKLYLKMAKMNGVTAEKAERLLERFYKVEQDTENSLLVAAEKFEERPTPTPPSPRFTYLDLLQHGVVRFRSLCMWLTWFVCSVIYYGVALNTSNMGGDPYINCFVAAAVEIPAYALSVGFLQCHGRKPMLISTLLVAGLTCSAVPYLKQTSDQLAVAFAMIGKLSISATFSILYIVCSELFPTPMRSMGMGSSSMFARIGGMVAPYMLYLGEFYESAPYLIMGVLSITSGTFSMLLPETRNGVLPETISDLEPMKYPIRWPRIKHKKDEICKS